MALNIPVNQVVSFGSTDGFAVTPDDNTPFAKKARLLYVGGTGDITLITPAGTTLLFKSVPVGFFHVQASQVKATGTTATNIVALT